MRLAASVLLCAWSSFVVVALGGCASQPSSRPAVVAASETENPATEDEREAMMEVCTNAFKKSVSDGTEALARCLDSVSPGMAPANEDDANVKSCYDEYHKTMARALEVYQACKKVWAPEPNQ